MNDRIVVGLDTDSHGFHWVANRPLWDGTGDDPEPTPFGFVRLGINNVDDRRTAVLSMARRFFRDLPIDVETHIFCEEPLALKNGKTTRALCLAAGAIWSAHIVEHSLTQHNVWWHWVDVASWKKAVVGKGNASKDDIRDFCCFNTAYRSERDMKYGADDDLISLGEVAEDNINLYDAWCLRVYGMRVLAGA